MICEHCGTEIAARALICFRCGEATVEAVRQPPPRRRRRWGLAMAGGAALAVAGASLGGLVEPVPPGPIGWIVASGGLLGLLWGLRRSRSRG